MKPQKSAPFVLMSSHHGTMIINRNDYHATEDNLAYGVGQQLMSKSCYDPQDVQLVLEFLRFRRHYYGDGVVAIDCGANIGVHTIEWANLMNDWGHVYAFEAQEKIYYALAGNTVINNCLNVSARYAAVGAVSGEINIPEPDYLVPSSFGSFELKKRQNTEFIGQTIDYDSPTKKVAQITLDSLCLPRVDFIKIDVEGMEEDVLNGACDLIEKFNPMMFIEIIKSNKENLYNFLTERNFTIFPLGINILAVHNLDPCLQQFEVTEGNLAIKKI